MDIFDQAMEIERKGESLYRQFSLESPDKGVKTIFSRLADQELKHFNVFKKLKEGKPAEVAENAILRDVKNIFEGWKESSACIDAKCAQADLYRRALAVEVESVEAYGKYALSASSPLKEIFLAIAAEEKIHQWIMENIIEFVTKPESWVENAEFSHLEEDYYL